MKNEVAVGIDIGGTTTVYGLIDKDGNCLLESNTSTRAFETARALVDHISKWIQEIMAENSELALAGIGVGAPNGNFHTGTIEYAPNLKWKGVINLVELFKTHFTVPIFVTNDANAATIGEMTYGSAKHLQDFLLITLGTGLGSGFVSNGDLIYGHDGFAGELGHIIIDRNGRLCGCGRKGCLETYASATGIVRTAIELIADQPDTPSDLRKIIPKDLTAKDIAIVAEKGDKLALEIFDFTAEKLGFGIANVIPVTSPKMIILFGGLAQSGDLLLTPLKKYVELNLLKNLSKQSGYHYIRTQ